MTYEYACAACGHEWEAEQSIREAPLKKCPHCGKSTAKRQISRGAGFILKGGGWYADGYGSSSGSSSSKSSSSSEKGSSSSEGSGGSKKAGSESSSDGGSSSSSDAKAKTAAA
jgi:putative FmdB family regulatory protein